MRKYRTILWDIDGTILNFLESEKAAIRKGFDRFNMGECSDAMLAHYSEINKTYWKKLERGELTKPEILVARFRDFFASYNIDILLAEDFNDNYQVDLGDTICFNDNSKEILTKLGEKYKQYAVTNGTAVAQNKKLKNSGLDSIFNGIYISEQIGFEKPDKRYFDKVFELIQLEDPDFDKSEAIIVGDSLSSDILGGNNASIATCWYNPNGEKAYDNLRIDYDISNLNEIFRVLE